MGQASGCLAVQVRHPWKMMLTLQQGIGNCNLRGVCPVKASCVFMLEMYTFFRLFHSGG